MTQADIDFRQADLLEFRKDIVGALAMFGNCRVGIQQNEHGYYLTVPHSPTLLTAKEIPALFYTKYQGQEATLNCWLQCVLSSSIANDGTLRAPELFAKSFDPFNL